MKYFSLIFCFAIVNLCINALVLANLAISSNSLTPEPALIKHPSLDISYKNKPKITKPKSFFINLQIPIEISYIKSSKQFNENSLLLAQNEMKPNFEVSENTNFAVIKLPSAGNNENQYPIINNTSYTQYQEITN